MKASVRTNFLAAKTSEECGELIQALCKFLNSNGRKDNIEHEIGDLEGCLSILKKELSLDTNHIQEIFEKRRKRIDSQIQKLA